MSELTVQFKSKDGVKFKVPVEKLHKAYTWLMQTEEGRHYSWATACQEKLEFQMYESMMMLVNLLAARNVASEILSEDDAKSAVAAMDADIEKLTNVLQDGFMSQVASMLYESDEAQERH